MVYFDCVVLTRKIDFGGGGRGISDSTVSI